LTVVAIMPTWSYAQSSDHVFSGNVTLASDYLFRGQSQTDNGPAVQGGVDYNHAMGLYLGTWASNINFADGIEIDYYGGFAGEMGDFSYDLTAVYYAYPSSDNDEDFLEFGPSVTYAFAGDFEPTLTVGFLYSDDYSFNSGSSVWLYSDLGIALPNDFGLGFHVGHQWIKDNATWGTPDWLEYNVSLSKNILGLDFAVTYSDTDLSQAECFVGGNICDEKVVFSISAGF
ncbi:MAG: TorF family putative porin, partial [Gammaproteobacteria bacterium]